MVAGVERAVRWSLATMVVGLAATTVGLLGQVRVVALAGLAGYAAGLAVALGPFLRTMLRRRPHTAASWMLGAGLGWLAFSVVVDLVALAGSPQVIDLDHGSTGWFQPSWPALPCRC
jgi:nitrite reductase (NO-forming)